MELRFGTAAATSRGFNNNDFKEVGNIISDVLDSLLKNPEDQKIILKNTREKILQMCKNYPIYQEAY